MKLGGSLLTDKRKKESLHRGILKRIAAEIHSAHTKSGCKLVVGHGGGSYPHFPAKRFKVKDGFSDKESLKGFALTQDAASRLNRIVVKELLGAGENAVSMQPSACFVCENDRIAFSFLRPAAEMLKHGILPVPFGDAVIDMEKGATILSTESILKEIALKLNAQRIIVAGNVEGVFTADPTKDKKAEMIREITKENYPIVRNFLAGSHGVDVTGGMLHKVGEMLKLTDFGISSQIISGEKKGNLEKAILGERTGTLIR